MNPETYLKTNVLIVGKGVSGLILAYLLHKKGINYTLLERETNTTSPILAETIPPSTLSLLHDIQLLSLFENCASRTYGYQSKWHTSTISDENFFKHAPYKYGLKLNKRKVITNLEKELTIKPIPYNQLLNIDQNGKDVITSIKSNHRIQFIKSNLIIDATGRNRAIGKKLGVSTKTYDENLAFICYVPKVGPHLKYGFFTETFKDGWGTVSNLNETTRIITLYTFKKSSLHQKLNSFSNWHSILSNTVILKYCLPQNGDFKIIGNQANSSKTNQIVNNKFLAIGDAAISFDPISSHGISNAIFCANLAVKTIDSFLNDKNSITLQKYEDTLTSVFNEYLKQKEKLYNVKRLQHL